LGLSPHLHAIAADGVWVQSEPDAPPTFHALPEPSRGEIASVAWSTCERTVKLLQKRGLWLDADPNDDRLAQEQPLLAALATASIAGVLAMGPNAGQRPMRLFGQAARDAGCAHEKAPKNAYGFAVACPRACVGPRSQSTRAVVPVPAARAVEGFTRRGILASLRRARACVGSSCRAPPPRPRYATKEATTR